MTTRTDLPAPLVPPEVDLRDFGFMPLDVLRLRDSDLAALATGDEFKAAVLLWCVAWHQVPAASLPKDDRLLARFSGAGPGWKKIREEALRGFVECSDGRYYHAVIAEKALRAWNTHHRLRHAALRKYSPKRIKGARWQVVRAKIFQRDGAICRNCGSTENLEIDHRHPLAEGGTHHPGNLQVLCRVCNRRKSFKVAA